MERQKTVTLEKFDQLKRTSQRTGRTYFRDFMPDRCLGSGWMLQTEPGRELIVDLALSESVVIATSITNIREGCFWESGPGVSADWLISRLTERSQGLV
jgi:hypothetical protein